jgi:hypothetical protein
MVVEHTFITTMEASDALRQAADFLGQRGFVASRQDAFSMDAGNWTSLEVRRGKPDPRNARRLLDFPQMVRLEFDRGRVSVAVSIMDMRNRSKASQALLVAIANSLEALLERRVAPEQAGARWDAVEVQLRRRSIRRMMIRWGVLCAILMILIGAAYLSSRR